MSKLRVEHKNHRMAPYSVPGTSSPNKSPTSKPLYIFMDLETTGLGNYTDISIIEIGAVVGRDTFSSLVYTNRRIQPGALKVHGLYNHDLEGEEPFPVVFKLFTSWLTKTIKKHSTADGVQYYPVLVAHNGFDYDYKILASEIKRHKLNFGFPADAKFADSLNYLRQLQENRNPLVQGIKLSLPSLSKRFLPDGRPTAHRALQDSQELRRLFTETELKDLLPFIPLRTYDDLLTDQEQTMDAPQTIQYKNTPPQPKRFGQPTRSVHQFLEGNDQFFDSMIIRSKKPPAWEKMPGIKGIREKAWQHYQQASLGENVIP